MQITVASGKGGTGKTTVATSLALSLAANTADLPPLFLDCDVEAPNAHLFLKPTFENRKDVSLMIPSIDESKCTSCGKCEAVCEYHAIAVLGKKVLVFPQLCHGCGSCTLVCPTKAIQEVPDVMGVLESGSTPSGINFAHGILNVGEPMAVPVIRQLKKWRTPQPGQVVIVDAPPGTSCPVVESVRHADFLLLVTEPTPFGLHDLKLATQVANELKIPVGIIINRDGIGNAAVEDYCAAEGLPVLMRIPYDRTIAEGTAQGQALVEIYPEYNALFQKVFVEISRVVAGQ
jgi:MinD superfamily P-loop ATPase